MALFVFLLSFSLVLAIPNVGRAVPETLADSDLHNVNVAIYFGDGSLGSSVMALKYMFLWMNATVELIDGAQIRNGTLDTYDILAFPGGSATSYVGDLEAEGLDIVREFVRDGGSYFGICGGAMFATNAALGLFNGSYSSPISGIDTYLTEMFVNRNSTGPDLSSEPDSYQTMYWGSAYFYSDDMSGVIPIANYSLNNRPGMIALTYGQGTVFLSSPHPEYEEGDNRDGTNYCDYLSDPDSEWPLLLRVSCWLVNASSNENTDSGIAFPEYITLLVLGSAGLLGLGLVIYLTRFRKS